MYKDLVAVFLLVACKTTETPQDISQREARQRAQSRGAYVQQSEVEYENYNRRQKVADDPTAIIWCTSSFGSDGSLFTVPIIGKLTSGGKRPYPDTGGPGPDGMYGSSGEYRYGFTPAGVYADWTNMAVFCTTMPMEWQRNRTTIVFGTDAELLKAQEEARIEMKAGNDARAAEILREAVMRTNPPPAEVPAGVPTR